MNKKVNKRKWEGKKMIDEKVKSDFRSIFCKNTMCKILLHSGFLVFLFRFFHMWYKCLHVCVCVCVACVCTRYGCHVSSMVTFHFFCEIGLSLTSVFINLARAAVLWAPSSTGTADPVIACFFHGCWFQTQVSMLCDKHFIE